MNYTRSSYGTSAVFWLSILCIEYYSNYIKYAFHLIVSTLQIHNTYFVCYLLIAPHRDLLLRDRNPSNLPVLLCMIRENPTDL